MLDAIDKHLFSICREVAVNAVFGAVLAWDADKKTKDLTGNMRTSFAAGIYKDGNLKKLIGVFDVGGSFERPTRRMTTVGDTRFKIYGTNYYIGSEDDPFVMEYNEAHRNKGMFFQPTDTSKYGYQTTKESLRAYSPREHGWVVVVASATPYGEFLYNIRKMDILETQSASGEIIRKLNEAIAASGSIEKYIQRK